MCTIAKGNKKRKRGRKEEQAGKEGGGWKVLKGRQKEKQKSEILIVLKKG